MTAVDAQITLDDAIGTLKLCNGDVHWQYQISKLNTFTDTYANACVVSQLMLKTMFEIRAGKLTKFKLSAGGGYDETKDWQYAKDTIEQMLRSAGVEYE